MKNIIFLDIDGVLNSTMGFMMNNEIHIWKPNIDLFYEAVRQIPDCKIVISSSWRSGDKDHFLKFVENMRCKELFEPLVQYLHPDYCTDKLWKKRGYEIREWLSRHPEVEKYICIDDDSDFLRGQPLLLIDRDIGFSMRDQYILLMYFEVIQNDSPGYGMKHILGDMRCKKRLDNHRLQFAKKYLPPVPEKSEF